METAKSTDWIKGSLLAVILSFEWYNFEWLSYFLIKWMSPKCIAFNLYAIEVSLKYLQYSHFWMAIYPMIIHFTVIPRQMEIPSWNFFWKKNVFSCSLDVNDQFFTLACNVFDCEINKKKERFQQPKNINLVVFIFKNVRKSGF